MSEWHWRAMEAADIDGVVAVAGICFPDHFEERACFEERLALFAPGCFVLDRAGKVGGYLMAYPWPEGSVPPLNGMLGTLSPARDAFWLHDLAVLPGLAGQGFARPVVDRLVEQLHALGGRRLALVAVNGSQGFWQKLGFQPEANASCGYGDGASYMIRNI